MVAVPEVPQAAWRRVALAAESLVVRLPVVTPVARPRVEWRAATREALRVAWAVVMPVAPQVE